VSRRFPRGVVYRSRVLNRWVGLIVAVPRLPDGERWRQFATWAEALTYVNETLESLHDKETEQ